MAPLEGLDHALRSANKSSSVDVESLEVGSVEYKQQLIGYIKENYNLFAIKSESTAQPNTRIRTYLGRGKIKLDDHMTQFIFEIKEMPAMPEKLEFHFPYMVENRTQNNIVRLINDKQHVRYTLSAANDFFGEDNGFFYSHSGD